MFQIKMLLKIFKQLLLDESRAIEKKPYYH